MGIYPRKCHIPLLCPGCCLWWPAIQSAVVSVEFVSVVVVFSIIPQVVVLVQLWDDKAVGWGEEDLVS